jgi:predicted nuclease with TOPRIM domain
LACDAGRSPADEYELPTARLLIKSDIQSMKRSLTLKTLLALLLAAGTLSLAPSARAFERKQSWEDAANIANTLDAQLDKVHAWRERYGAGPELQNEVEHLHVGLAELDERIQNRRGEPKEAVTKAHDLWNLMTSVEAEFRDRARHERGIEIEVFHDEWRLK